MKIIKKITHRRAKALPEYEYIKDKFADIKSKGGQKTEGIERSQSLDKLNYFIVLEYFNMAEKIDYAKIFPTDDYVIDVEGLLNEQDKIIQLINKRKDNYPEMFYKLGFVNEVVGCFLIATRKSKMNHISTKNTKNTISIKIKDTFPREIKEMCNDYYAIKSEASEREQEEFIRFNRLSFDERDIILQNILENAAENSVAFFYPPDNRKRNKSDLTQSGATGTVKLEEVFNQNIEKITSIEFLRSLLYKAEQKENYEFCAKIRDRLEFLKVR
jgi:hypothetical protein